MIFSAKAKREQKAEALRSMKRDTERIVRNRGHSLLEPLDPGTTNYAQMFRRPLTLVGEPVRLDSEYCGTTVNRLSGRSRCPYCGIKRADDGRSCDGCGGHL